MTRSEAKHISFQVDESSDLPLWVQLRNRIAYLVDSGYLQPGDQLPSVRSLASDLSINYNTVNKTYLGLKNDGYVKSERGRGAFVRQISPDFEDGSGSQAEQLVDECIESCLELGMTLDDVQTLMNRRVSSAKSENESASRA